jgi:hypothetical protein
VTTSQPPTATAPSPTQDGLISICNNFYKIVKGDTCAKIVQAYGTSNVAQFTQWNPAVGDDCSGLWTQTHYYVGVPGTATVRPSSSAPVSTAPSGPSPTQDGIISTCTQYHKAVSGDTCQKDCRLVRHFLQHSIPRLESCSRSKMYWSVASVTTTVSASPARPPPGPPPSSQRPSPLPRAVRLPSLCSPLLLDASLA